MATTQEMIDRINAEFNIDIQRIGRMYGYYAYETMCWYWVNIEDLKYGIEVASSDEEECNKYSLWCAGCVSREISEKTIRKHELHS